MNNKKGYTLVELIITLAVVSIMIVPIFNAFLQSNRVNLMSRKQISAAYLAQNELEDIKGMTRAQFNAYDETDDGIFDILKSDFEYHKITKISNGGTEFDVEITINNVTDQLGITANEVMTHVEDIRDAHCTITLPDTPDNTNNLISTHTYSFNTHELDLLIKKVDDSTSELIIGGANPVVTISHSEFIGALPDADNRIILNLVGNELMEDGSDEWTFNIINQTEFPVDVKPFIDEFSNIHMKASSDSSNDIYIGNVFPMLIGDPSTPKEWFDVVIKVSHNGVVFETIESTVGK
ncbi:MAG: type II secretion system protein [Clostridiales bacterium]|nr:type II secretion system protein [Clostridiales bacterium]